MSRQFSIPTILRMVPNELLKEFFAALGHADFDPRWHDLGNHEIEPMLGYITELPNSQSNGIEQELRSVYELSCDSGIRSIVEAAKMQGLTQLVFQIPEGLTVHGRAMWVRLRHPRVFEVALFLHEVDSLTWWRKRNDLPSSDPDRSPDAIAQLQRDICAMLKPEGRGKECTVETYSRGDIDYFFAYPDDFVETAHMHDDDGNLISTAIRKTMQVVLAYDRAEGTLESYAKLNKPMKEQLEQAFAERILRCRLGSHDPGKAYELDHLKDETFVLTTDPRDRVNARIVKLRLSGRTNGRHLQLEADRDKPDETIHQLIAECLDTESVPLWQWKVTRVSICFEFLPLPGRKPGHQTITIGYPRSCNLRSARPERVEVIQKYLKLWKIDRARPTKKGVVALGA